MTGPGRSAPDGRTPAAVQALAEVLDQAHRAGVRYGGYTLARHILGAGYGPRPCQPAHKHGSERITHTLEGRQVWRQVGWHGQTGALYALHEDPAPTEPGSFMPLWILVDDEPPVLPDEELTDV